MPLKDTEIRALKPGAKDQKLFDGGGLYLLVKSSGSKLWQMKIRVDGKEKKLSFGKYPIVTLKDARAKRDDAKRMLAQGIDPARKKREDKQAAKQSAENSFELVAREYISKIEKEGRAEATLVKARWLLAQLQPGLGKLPIAEIEPPELLRVLKKVEEAGKRETAKRMRSFASRVFRYGVATGRCLHDPASVLRGALLAPIVKHHAAIVDPVRLGELLRAIDGYQGQPAAYMALRLTPHVFQRPGEVRQMRWSEIDLDNAVWAIPAGRMKQRQPHHVPLSRQSVDLLTEMKGLSGHSEFVFPSIRTPKSPMSENTINAALRRLGYGGDEMTAHGFRTTASSLLNESGKWNPDAIERALSHADKNAIRGTYNRSAYWKERVEMAQWWSDYLDQLRRGATVVDIQSKQRTAGK
ncbi:tyrosine-type recombinase/integrase [Parasphingorhabdus sp.]|uniref:tyrosine-type recombinase/integrase n=1 Tax=Parasphingorhabdus sp. TaxID=2709688 RepID=UPI003D299D1E